MDPRRTIVFGNRHLDHLISEFVTYYNTRRSHMERDHLQPIRDLPEEIDCVPITEVIVRSRLAGLVKSIERRAA